MHCLAHRGFAAVAPENTVEALADASEVATMVEFDVRRCGSGELVVVHDETVDRVSDGSGRVADHSLDSLSALDVLGTGAGVPTLEAVLSAVPDDAGLNVEVKERGLTEDLLDALASHGHEVLVSSFDDEALREVQAVSDLPLATVFDDGPDRGLDSAAALGATAVHPHWELVDEGFVERAHERGLSVNCWTIRGAAGAERARAAGVDGIISDDPRFCRG